MPYPSTIPAGTLVIPGGGINSSIINGSVLFPYVVQSMAYLNPNVTSQPVGFTNTPTAGNILLVFSTYSNGTSITSIPGYNLIVNETADGYTSSIWGRVATGTSSDNATVNFSNSNYLQLSYAMEFANAMYPTNYVNGPAVAYVPQSPVLTVSAGSLILGLFSGQNEYVGAPADTTLTFGNTTGSNSSNSFILATSKAYTAGTITSSINWAATAGAVAALALQSKFNITNASSAPTIRQSNYAFPLGSSSTQVFNNTTTIGNTLLFFGIYTSGSISVPTGWTQLGNANGLFCFYKTATGTSADNFTYSGFTGTAILAEFSSTGTPYNFTTTNTGSYSYNAPILTTTGPAIVIAFYNCNSGQPSLTSPGWTISWQTGSDFGNQRSIVVGWIQTSSSKDVSFSSLTDDNNTRYIAQFALGN